MPSLKWTALFRLARLNRLVRILKHMQDRDRKEVVATINATARIFVNNDVVLYGFAFMDVIVGNILLRIAGVYMLAINSIWTRAEVMTRWLVIVTYILALGFFFFAGTIREARFLFPGWVFLVSLYILILSYRIDVKRGSRRTGPTN